MSTFRTPVGPQPSRVYWRRRLIVGIGLLAVVLIVILIVVRPGSGAPTPAPTGSTVPSASASPDPAAGDVAACDPKKVTVEAVTDATSYDAGVNPALSFSLKSLMTVPCSISAGSDVQEYRITSGDELIWSSKDCQSAPTPATIVLLPGVPKGSTPVTWDRTRSSATTCDSPRDQVIAGGASYHLDVTVDKLTSATSRQFLLN